MKLGVTYSAFEGITELLEQSILSIRENTDYINVMYQDTSWRGMKILDSDLQTLLRLKQIGLIDDLYLYSINEFSSLHNDALQIYERHKRLIGINRVKMAGCDHVLIMDSDEFYLPKQFKEAKDIIDREEIERSFVPYHTILNQPYFRVNLGIRRFTSFINRCDIVIDDRRFNSCNIKGGVEIDKTRVFCFDAKKEYLFNLSELTMFHMLGVRKDLYRKFFNNTGSPYEKTLNVIKDIRDINQKNLTYSDRYNPPPRKVEIIPNYFNIKEFAFTDSSSPIINHTYLNKPVYNPPPPLKPIHPVTTPQFKTHEEFLKNVKRPKNQWMAGFMVF